MSYLVLGRRDNETILIGNDIKIVLFKTRQGLAKVGIQAPEGMPIIRGELMHKLKQPVPTVESVPAAGNVA